MFYKLEKILNKQIPDLYKKTTSIVITEAEEKSVCLY